MASRKLDWRDGRLDKIIAVGVASRSNTLCDALVALKYANAASAYPVMLTAVRGMARQLNIQHRWRAEQQLGRMAKRVLDYWLADRCVECGGVGHQHVVGAPARHHRVCPVCNGTGGRVKPWAVTRLPPALSEKASDAAKAARRKRVVELHAHALRHNELLERLDLAERQVEKTLARVLKRREA